MLNTTAYLNLLTKQKEILMKMQNHKLNLKNMKSINNNSPQLKPVSINKNKTKYIKSRNQHEVDVENQVLTEKIERIIKSSRNNKYFSGNEKYSKSLNGHVMRTRQERINEDNLRLLQRLEHSKPTYSTKKYLQEFQHLKKVQKNMSSAEFYLTDSPRFRKPYQLNTNRSFITRRDSSVASGNSMVKDGKRYIVRDTVKLSDGKLWQVKIYFSENKRQGMTIQGEVLMDEKGRDYQQEHQNSQQNERSIKVINMPITEANIFIARHCQNKIENMLDFLKVDQSDGSLLIVVPKNVSSNKKINNHMNKNKSLLPSPTKLINPQEKKTNEVKLKKLQSLAGYEKKRIPSRQIFNTVQNKPALIDHLLESNDKSAQKQNQEKKSKIVKQQKQKQMPSLQREPVLLNQSLKQISKKLLKKNPQHPVKVQSKNQDKNEKEDVKIQQAPGQKVQQIQQKNTNQNENKQQQNQVDKKPAQQQQAQYEEQEFDQSTTKNMKPLQKSKAQQQININNNTKQKTNQSQQKQIVEENKQQNQGNLIKSIQQLPINEKLVESENDHNNQQQNNEVMQQSGQKVQQIENNRKQDDEEALKVSEQGKIISKETVNDNNVQQHIQQNN